MSSCLLLSCLDTLHILAAQHCPVAVERRDLLSNHRILSLSPVTLAVAVSEYATNGLESAKLPCSAPSAELF